MASQLFQLTRIKAETSDGPVYETSSLLEAPFSLAPAAFGWPMIEPPGLPSERLEQLREAFAKALKYPAVAAYAKQLDWHLEAKSGEDLQP